MRPSRLFSSNPFILASEKTEAWRRDMAFLWLTKSHMLFHLQGDSDTLRGVSLACARLVHRSHSTCLIEGTLFCSMGNGFRSSFPLTQ